MNILLAHGNFDWLFAGGIVFIGAMVLFIKIARGHIFSSIISVAFWFMVFSLHNGSTVGIMTATWAALLFDFFGLPLIKLSMRFRT